MLNINRYNSKQETTAAAGEALSWLLSDNNKIPILILLSGGSALAMLDYISLSSLSENITISVLDERFSEDPQINNFSRLQKTDFYKEAFDAGCSFFGTLPRPKETALNLSKRWENNLRQWKTSNVGGKIFTTLGMGQDGHTAGIFPFVDDTKRFTELFESENWAVAYSASGKTEFPERITATIPFLKQIDEGIAFVSGTEKKEKLEEMIAKIGTIETLPVLAWHQIKKVEVFTDIKLKIKSEARNAKFEK